MNGLSDYYNLTSSQKTIFQRVCRKLLKTTFIVKEKSNEQRTDFYFIKNNHPAFSEYFSIMGYDVVVEESSGVAMLVNMSRDDDSAIQANRLRMKLGESAILCCLWFLYADRMTSGSLTASIIISKSDLDMEIEKLGYNNKIDKSTMQSALDLFEEFNLIEVIGKITELDCKIRLFTSLQFCMSDTEFQNFVEITIPKMKDKKKYEEKININEEEEYEDNE